MKQVIKKYKVGNLLRYSPKILNLFTRIYRNDKILLQAQKSRVWEIIDITKDNNSDLITLKIKLTNKEDAKNLGYCKSIRSNEITDYVFTKHKVNIPIKEIKDHYHPLTSIFSDFKPKEENFNEKEIKCNSTTPTK